MSQKPTVPSIANTASPRGGIALTLPRSQWTMPPRRLMSTSEVTTVMAAAKNSPTITPASTSVCTGSPAPAAAMK